MDHNIAKTEQLQKRIFAELDSVPPLPEKDEVRQVMQETMGHKAQLFRLAASVREAEVDMKQANWFERHVFPWYAGKEKPFDLSLLETGIKDVYDDTVVRTDVCSLWT